MRCYSFGPFLLAPLLLAECVRSQRSSVLVDFEVFAADLLPDRAQTSLLAKLKAARAALDRGQREAAKRALKAFSNALRRPTIPPTIAATLRQVADTASGTLDQFTADPSPGPPGGGVYPWPEICEVDYSFVGDRDEARQGRVFAPALFKTVQSGITICVTWGPLNGKFNLAVIAHAKGATFESYDGLATHLAGNAIITASIDRSDAVNQVEFGSLLTDHINCLYDSDQCYVKGFITDNMALIGHSQGGGGAVKHAPLINLPKIGGGLGRNLKSLIVLAPAIAEDDLATELSFTGVADAFLGLHVTCDSDSATWGIKDEDLPMKTAFKLYDDAAITRDMIYFTSFNLHYFQNDDISLAYINTHLQIYLNGHSIFNRFLKLQETPPGIVETVYQQHAESPRLVLANFENHVNLLKHNQQGDIVLPDSGIQDWDFVNAFEFDEFSPHNTKVLTFLWDGSDLGNPPVQIKFELSPPLNVAGYSYFSFRATQIYPLNNPCSARDFDIIVRSQDGGEAALSASTFGGLLHCSMEVPAATCPVELLDTDPDQTKNAMRSYIVPLADFIGVDFSVVTELVFQFTGNDQAYFIFDDLEFYQ